MLINFKQLKNLPVETQSGQNIGKVLDIIIDIESQAVRQYIIKPSGIQNIFDKELLVNQSQIASITKNKIIVMDGTYNQGVDEKIELMRAQPHLQAQPVARK